MQLKRRLGQRGDTIVEVLIAIAVVTGVLATSYAIVNYNSRSYQTGSERVEALKVAEQQIEKLRAGTVPVNQSNIGPANRYSVTVTNSGVLYDIQVSWDGLGGGTENINLKYRN